MAERYSDELSSSDGSHDESENPEAEATRENFSQGFQMLVSRIESSLEAGPHSAVQSTRYFHLCADWCAQQESDNDKLRSQIAAAEEAAAKIGDSSLNLDADWSQPINVGTQTKADKSISNPFEHLSRMQKLRLQQDLENKVALHELQLREIRSARNRWHNEVRSVWQRHQEFREAVCLQIHKELEEEDRHLHIARQERLQSLELHFHQQVASVKKAHLEKLEAVADQN
eukprot:gnl/MRDRNA2_/MRDRNA2_218148_c0_seq1.p1 gnl/MRDRNA2_/MRDRNA2_218148_c0~~gnl/MRDRNA2_/MRDRNA2_218148_c0_seq1.p1  ORF type:complete len:229 (+),score=63.22 gnl/MRDRNA2_/MRDRNA2_218148_c0_seq1:52-738(+)